MRMHGLPTTGSLNPCRSADNPLMTFPSPAAYFAEGRLSLDEHLVENKDATFFFRTSGDTLAGLGIRARNVSAGSTPPRLHRSTLLLARDI